MLMDVHLHKLLPTTSCGFVYSFYWVFLLHIRIPFPSSYLFYIKINISFEFFRGHYFDQNYRKLRPAKLIFVDPGCQCRVCAGKWSSENVTDGNNVMNERQKNFFCDWFMLRMVAQAQTQRVMNETCKGLDMLRNRPHTKQYLALYKQFRMFMCRWQYLATDNVVLIQ